MKRLFYSLLLLCVFYSCKETPTSISDILPEILITEEGKVLPLDSTTIATLKDSLLIEFYQKNDAKTHWVAFNCREDLLNLLNAVEDEGLNPKDFDLKPLNALEKKLPKLSDKELIEYDFLLTQNLLKLITQANVGTTSPQQLYDDWDLKPNTAPIKEKLFRFLNPDNFDAAVAALSPQHHMYQKLKKALQLLKGFPKDPGITIIVDGKIEPNDSLSELINIKKKLQYWGEMKKSDSLSNHYDEETLLAVKKFQFRHGLAPDGVIGRGTAAALNKTKEERKQQIIANLERWRWFPHDFPSDYLLVNIPDYSLTVVKEKDTVRNHRVIVGTAQRKTPILQSKLSYLVYNPTWTVPPTILKNDVIPATQKNRSYLTGKNITVYDSKGNVVSPDNWEASKARSYRYVQSPGKTNSLGLVKIMFPNRFSVYLHDTNSRGYFEREIRSLSSGCIRVQNPFELCEYLLNDAEQWPMDTILEAVNTGKTRNVDIKGNYQLYILYWTAWSQGDVLIFRDDIYNLDAALYKKLRN
ncbi:MAG: murein L,D-transpeptidase [Flavobacterium sp.]